MPARPPATTLLCLMLAACSTAPSPGGTTRNGGGPGTEADAHARGASLYDKWYAGRDAAFEPDDDATPQIADGRGGPNGDGTLNGADGKPMPNTGHDYRLKNFFGWDLRGSAGIYGADYQAKAHVLDVDLLTVAWTRQQMAQHFADGAEGMPAYGSVLDAAEIGLVVDFVFAIREGALPHPDQVFERSAGTPGNYRLRAGGDPGRGLAVIASQCADCHGEDGRRFAIDGSYSLGAHVRQKAYEDWFKFIGGQPGSSMGRQLPAGKDGAAHAAFTLDVLAALCDRDAFPAAEGAQDVPDGDPRCGAYLN